ncbi:L-seryl-tRNA(Sec) selenium transferase [Megasphaera sp.]|uniref:L-seryl-tRNA(Sec) selenium transferase n=1 Tax=Megasphaera sp. TaxID=2023260 RepID=UPI0035228859
MNEVQQKLLRQLPDVDHLLQRPRLLKWQEKTSRKAVRDAVRAVLDRRRQAILDGQATAPFSADAFDQAVIACLQHEKTGHLRRVINATGTILHTNLGRSVFSPELARHIADVSCHYSNLEYDLPSGKRGLRYDHVRSLICDLTGAEDALVVNNNAAAVLLTLASLTAGREVVISRGELVEIGGSFRIPEVIEQSGSTICEVGTTNKTHLRDYEKVIGEKTAALMKVHTSNYHIIGFTETVSPAALAELAHTYDLPCIHDLGSGLFVDLERFGLPHEPTVREALEAGCDVVTFSGDKLLGGPQAGIIAGKAAYLQTMKHHPLLRALRVDKMTMACLEGTLQAYRNDTARRHIPTLRCLAQTKEEGRQRAVQLLLKLEAAQLPADLELIEVDDCIGGGACPDVSLPGWAVTVQAEDRPPEKLAEQLRFTEVPIIARIVHDRVVLSQRTIGDDEFDDLVRMLGRVLNS